MNRQPTEHAFKILDADAIGIIDTLLAEDRRVLLFGAMGVGKSTLVCQLAEQLSKTDRNCWCLSADPGTPLFGVPGAITLGHFEQGTWQVDDYVALCTLDAGRFRLPLVAACQQLLLKAGKGVVMLVDAPGVVRGIAGRELLEGLVTATAIDLVLVVTPTPSSPPLLDELSVLDTEVVVINTGYAAMRPGKRARDRKRTAQWDNYLAASITQTINLNQYRLVGTPPPCEVAEAWAGRQVALLGSHQIKAMGEVQFLKGNQLTINLPVAVNDTDTLLIRDVQRGVDGFLETAIPWVSEPLGYLPPSDVLSSVQNNNGPRLVGRAGNVDIALINGVFGDPLLHVRLRHQRRSLLFDLGSGERLSARIAHQVTDVFITHAHMDHISGFTWLLRSRIGDYPPCRLYGPPGLAQHVAGFLQGILWDRVDIHEPHFEVMEYDGQHLQVFHLKATQAEPVLHHQHEVEEGLLLEDNGFRVRGVLLDHHGTPVMAYALEPDKQINVRKDRLKARGLEAGPWLNELKQQVLANNTECFIRLPDDTEQVVMSLADELLLISAAKHLVYATDLSDTPDNRQRLVKLAHNAHTFLCEAPFVEAEAEHAFNNGHLTTRACAEIASAAGVARLVPFHLSRRHMDEPQQIYEEIKKVCPQVVMPASPNLFDAQSITPEEAALALD